MEIKSVKKRNEYFIQEILRMLGVIEPAESDTVPGLKSLGFEFDQILNFKFEAPFVYSLISSSSARIESSNIDKNSKYDHIKYSNVLSNFVHQYFNIFVDFIELNPIEIYM